MTDNKEMIIGGISPEIPEEADLPEEGQLKKAIPEEETKTHKKLDPELELDDPDEVN